MVKKKSLAVIAVIVFVLTISFVFTAVFAAPTRQQNTAGQLEYNVPSGIRYNPAMDYFEVFSVKGLNEVGKDKFVSSTGDTSATEKAEDNKSATADATYMLMQDMKYTAEANSDFDLSQATFTGTLDGRGMNISNLPLKNGTCLFGTNSGTITGVKLTNVSFTAASGNTGLLANVNSGDITDCNVNFNTSLVSAPSNFGAVTYNNAGNIIRCFTVGKFNEKVVDYKLASTQSAGSNIFDSNTNYIIVDNKDEFTINYMIGMGLDFFPNADVDFGYSKGETVTLPTASDIDMSKLATDANNLTVFGGWYNNPEYLGNAITVLGGQGNKTLYAQWVNREPNEGESFNAQGVKYTYNRALKNFTSAVTGGENVTLYDEYMGMPVVIQKIPNNVTITNLTLDFKTQTKIPSDFAKENKTLVTLNIRGSITELSKNAFSYCSNLESVSMPNVTIIGDGAFTYDYLLKSIALPNVTIINAYAFQFTGITDVTAPKLVTLGEYSFGFSKLVNVSLPILTKIPEGTPFNSCTSLKSVNIPKLTNVPATIFTGLQLVQQVTVAKDCIMNESLDITKFSKETIGETDKYTRSEELFEQDNLILSVGADSNYQVLSYIGTNPKVVIPETFNGKPLTHIAEKVFYGKDFVTSITGNNIITLAKQAIYNCKKLESISFPNATTSVGSYQFSSCVMLTDINLPNMETIGFNSFGSCKALKTLNLPKVTTLGDSIPYVNTSLEIFNAPLVTKVGADFKDCLLINTIIVAEGCTFNAKFDSTIFTKTTVNSIDTYERTVKIISENGFNYLPDGDNYKLVSYSGTEVNIVIPQTVNGKDVTSIAERSFYSNKKIQSITGNSILHVGFLAFSDSSISRIVFPNLTTVDTNAFQYCKELTSVDFPKLTVISDALFRSCILLESINCPNAISVGKEAFSECNVLIKIDMPLVTTVGDDAFNSCTSLISVNLPLATTFGLRAFSGCSVLAKIDLPSATNLGDFVFSTCNLLTEVNIPKVTTVGKTIFSTNNLVQKITIAKGKVPTGLTLSKFDKTTETINGIEVDIYTIKQA